MIHVAINSQNAPSARFQTEMAAATAMGTAKDGWVELNIDPRRLQTPSRSRDKGI